MAGIARSYVIGNITADVVAKTVGNDKIVASFSVAVNRKWGTERVDYIRCEFWGKQAEICANYLKKGQLVHVEGDLLIDKSADNKEFHKIRGDRMTMLGGKGNNFASQTDSNTSSNASKNIEDLPDDIPF